MDNASNNDTMMKELAWLLNDRDIAFDSNNWRIKCYGHIVDLSSKCIIDGISQAKHSEDWVAPTQPTQPTTYSNALACNIISHSRTVVQVIWGSGMRRDAFEELIVNSNSKGWFKGGQPPENFQLNQLQLLWDVRSRWDSVHLMLNRLRELCLVCLCMFYSYWYC